MAVVRWLAAVMFLIALGGCESLMKNDPIVGQNPWQPGAPPPQKYSSSLQ